MNSNIYQNLTNTALADSLLSREDAEKVLTAQEIELLPLLNAAYQVRKKFVGHEVLIHIINNAQNGHCPEDCHYCAQAKSSKSNIAEYPLKSDDEFLAEAKDAHEKGAHRYCMVFAGRGPSKGRVERLAHLIKKIKSQYPLEICVSAGLLDSEKAQVLKDAGLDRLNHNLNTSEKHYPKICTTHSYDDRMKTLSAARQAGIQLCSGVIAGMGETTNDIIDVAFQLRKMNVESIPVNFLIPIEGNLLDKIPQLTPEYCLRVLCLFRFLNPKAELRIAAGREIHLRSMEVMSLYPANSLFLEGYLNTKGEECQRTLQMIKDAGFTIKSNHSIDEILQTLQTSKNNSLPTQATNSIMKDLDDLRPFQKTS